MNKDALSAMSTEELDEYGKVLGLELASAKTRAKKLALIEQKRERTVEISVVGQTFSIRQKALSDQRLIDIIESKNNTDDDWTQALQLLLGEEQTPKLIEACTDEDGTIDANAIAYALVKILHSPDLKN